MNGTWKNTQKIVKSEEWASLPYINTIFSTAKLDFKVATLANPSLAPGKVINAYFLIALKRLKHYFVWLFNHSATGVVFFLLAH